MNNLFVPLTVSFCLLTAPFQLQLDRLYEYVETQDPQINRHNTYFFEIPQYFFRNVTFVEFAPAKYVTTAHSAKDTLWCLAIDDRMRTYNITGFDTCQFNQLLHDHPLTLDNYSVERFGRFFLELRRVHQKGWYHYIDDVDDFVNLNRQLVEEELVHGRCITKPFADVEKRIRDAFGDRELDRIEYDNANNLFHLDYYIWERQFGDLLYFRVSISTSGQCNVEFQDTLATELGYWGYD